MNYDELNKKLKELKIEDFIWLIYVGIIFLSWYSNSLERKYFVFNDLIAKEKYRKIIIFIFSILLIVYFYFLNGSYQDLSNIRNNTNSNDRELLYLSFIASLFIFISGAILLYIALEDNDLSVELAFN